MRKACLAPVEIETIDAKPLDLPAQRFLRSRARPVGRDRAGTARRDCGKEMSARLRIGIDFDNTIITYDDVFLATARAWGLLRADFTGSKQAIRDAIRLLPDGELSWQKLQGHVYGKGLDQAAMFEGVDAFLRRCRLSNAQVVIVSHKTEFGHHDPERVNLRDAARDWMTKHGFFRA